MKLRRDLKLLKKVFIWETSTVISLWSAKQRPTNFLKAPDAKDFTLWGSRVKVEDSTLCIQFLLAIKWKKNILSSISWKEKVNKNNRPCMWHGHSLPISSPLSAPPPKKKRNKFKETAYDLMIFLLWHRHYT